MNKTVSLTNNQLQVLSKYRDYGFESENDLLKHAIELLVNERKKQEELEMSAQLYCEIYDNDPDIRELTETALNDQK